MKTTIKGSKTGEERRQLAKNSVEKSGEVVPHQLRSKFHSFIGLVEKARVSESQIDDLLAEVWGGIVEPIDEEDILMNQILMAVYSYLLVEDD